ncbi:alpha/beta hydrolase [Amycolatopsis rhizosphaerae]|uniref:Alpha/beta hydrolase n=1 Tax=Amycolatopsis rhizosphaerae TaxID=2053003 RepID=A0A558D0U7_9PSEU|nr:alpha/beta hydrolase [Amycolatopsis rhizosphaerae]TVT54649.1 alpha/beta hydrolase [Amycolatopsis rhizosphaerae]
MPYFDAADGTRLFYRDWGTGQPVLLLASWGFGSAMWQHQMIHLADAGFRCLALDRRGHGRSDDPGSGYEFDTLADDVAALLDRLDLGQVTLVGHSMGGAEIVRYLTRHGTGRVKGVAMVAAALPFLLKTTDNPQGVDGTAAEEVRRGWRADLTRWLTHNAPPFFGAGLPGCEVSPGQQEWLLGMMTEASLKALVDCNKALTETDFRAEVAAITVPALIVHGDHDASTPLELTGERIADLVPHARFVVYENAPHGLFLTHREQLNEDLLAFAKG